VERGVCTIVDDKGVEIINEALSADLIVLATPIYEYCVSSTMKKFLERCLPLGKFSFGIIPRINTNKKKKAVILCTSGAPFPFNFLMGIAIYPKFILTKIAKFFGCGTIRSIFAGGMTGSEKTTQKYLKKAFELGKNI
jgi:FMN-dependent NADH-azoreductase